ncbi:MAG: hypothetical protein K2P81_11995 [Bacteriovoracaceae bacterium]|nr:hypothetical protein [Bacteriovoracaceae bacterium]
MKNLQYDLLELQKYANSQAPLTSIFIPMKMNLVPFAIIFKTLTDVANKLREKDGYPIMKFETPLWERWKITGAHSIAIYYTDKMIKIVPLSMKVQPRVIVAKSFHVKPIVACIESHQENMLLHFHNSGATLYRISVDSDEIIESYIPSSTQKRGLWFENISKSTLNEFLLFIKRDVIEASNGKEKFITITGLESSALSNEKFWADLKLPVIYMPDSLNSGYPRNAIALSRMRLLKNVDSYFTDLVSDYSKTAKSSDLDLTMVCSKIINQEISKLYVSLEDIYFGEIDPVTGFTKLNKSQKNTKDDDILDDLVELAIGKGINVHVVPRRFMPEGRALLVS